MPAYPETKQPIGKRIKRKVTVIAMARQELYQKIGLRLAQLRLEHGYSQADIAKEFHIGQTTYSSYENGTRKIPLDLVDHLAYFYNVSLTYLFRGNEDSKEDAAQQKKRLLQYFSTLNAAGRAKSIEYVMDLSHLKKYSAQEGRPVQKT